MKYPTRIYYTETDRAEMWNRWEKGESLNSIARQTSENFRIRIADLRKSRRV